MTTQDQAQASRLRALWVIAISLLIIAVCLVLMVIKQHRQKPDSFAARPEPEMAASEPIPEDLPVPPPKPTNTPPRRPVPAIAHPTPPPHPAPAALESEAVVQVLPESDPGVTVVSRTTHPGNTIVGRITLHGTPPPERFIALNSEPGCPELRTNPPTTQDFIVGTNGGLANVFVSIAGRMNNQLSAASRTNYLLTLADCKITPMLSGVLASQPLGFSNGTRDDHTLRIAATDFRSPSNRRLLSQVNLYPGLSRSRPAFQRAEDFIAIECAQHPWEFAYVCAVENSFFVIPNVPTGKYRVTARHLRISGTNALSRDAIVTADQPTALDFTFELPSP
jgi:hypothetical protein